jgi:hypothetical protein
VLNQLTHHNTVPGVRAGDSTQLVIGGLPTTWRVVGIVEERAGGGAYTTSEGFAEAIGQPERVNQLRIFTASDDERTRQAVATAVTGPLTDAGIKVRSAASISRSEAITEDHLTPVILILLGIALPLGVVGVIGLASIMSTNILDRTREFGVMHAIGARPKPVRRVVVAEGLFLAVTSLPRSSHPGPDPHRRPRCRARQPVLLRTASLPRLRTSRRHLGGDRQPWFRARHRRGCDMRLPTHRPRSPRLRLMTSR